MGAMVLCQTVLIALFALSSLILINNPMKWEHYYSHFMEQTKMIKSEKLAQGNTVLRSWSESSQSVSRAKYVLKSCYMKYDRPPVKLLRPLRVAHQSVNRNLVCYYLYYSYSHHGKNSHYKHWKEIIRFQCF